MAISGTRQGKVCRLRPRQLWPQGRLLDPIEANAPDLRSLAFKKVPGSAPLRMLWAAENEAGRMRLSAMSANSG
jgi:hypothetical protein